MTTTSRREIITMARQVVFEDEQPDFDFNRSSHSTNDARVDFKHAWQSRDGLRPVLNVVETGEPVGSNTSLGGSKLLYLLQPSSTSIETSNGLSKFEAEWVKHFSRQVLRQKPRKEANNPTPEVYSIHSLLKKGKLNIVRDGLRNGVYSGLVILDRRNHSNKVRMDEFSFEWDGEKLELSKLLDELSPNVGQTAEQNQLPHFFLALLTNAIEHADVEDLNEQYLDLTEGGDSSHALNMSLALPIAPENLPEQYAFEMASLFDLTNRLAEGIESLDFALIESQDEIASRLQRHDHHQASYPRNYLNASVVSNSSFLFFRTVASIGASSKKNADFNLLSLKKPLESLKKIPDLWEIYQCGLDKGHLTYDEAVKIEGVIKKIWRSGQVLLNQTRLLHDYKSVFFALNLAYLMDKAASKNNRSTNELSSVSSEVIKHIWESYNSEGQLALFSKNVWMYGRHDLPNDANQMRSIRSILYNSSSRGNKFFHAILETMTELGHEPKTLDDLEDRMDVISDGELSQPNPNFKPAHYSLILQEDFLNALEQAIGCHRYLYASDTELGWGSRWMRLFKVFDQNSVVSIDEIESKFLTPLNDVLSNLPDDLTFENPQLGWPTDNPDWDAMMINAIAEWVQGGLGNV